MRRLPGRARLSGLVLAVLTIAAGCGGGDDSGSSGGDLSGSITISGSSTVEPISAANAQKFASINPKVEISVDGPGTGDGFALFCEGKTDISDASRPIKLDEEAPICEENDIEFIELKIGVDGISLLTSHDNDEVDCLAFTDLYALLGPESEGFGNWSDANDLGAELDAPGAPYPDEPLVITAPGEESGTFDSFAELVLEGIAVDERGISEDGPFIRPDYQASPNDNVIIEGISSNPTSLGWVGYAFYVQNQDVVKALEVDGGDGCIAPTEETIKSAEYPISRFLYVYVNAAKAETNPAVAAYIDFYLSDNGIASVSEVGYVDVAEEDLSTTRSVWEDRETGSREG
jgi:phosphate transport system substrate-binding protein